MRIFSNSSYEADSSVYFLDFLKSRPVRVKSSVIEDDAEFDQICTEVSELIPLSDIEGTSLYTVAGWAVFKEKTPKACSECLSSITGNASTSPEYSQLTNIKSFEVGGGLAHPSSQIWQAIMLAETIFRLHEERVTKTERVCQLLLKLFFHKFEMDSFPKCHNIVKSVVGRFFRLRLFIHATRLKHECSARAVVQHGSRSSHCRTKVT